MERYPDRQEEVLFRLRWQSGIMGSGGHMRGLLNLTVCRSGLRIGITRLFGIFCRDFFVPWEEIEVRRKDWFFFKAAELSFGSPSVGTLTVSADVADRLARSSSGRWPEKGPFPREPNHQVLANVIILWAAITLVAGVFFLFVPRIFAPNLPSPPVAVAVGFPALVFGIVSVFSY